MADDKLYVTDTELIQKLGVDKITGEIAIAGFSAEVGFPHKDPLLANRRYWPAVKAFLDRRSGISMEAPTVIDGKENWDDPPTSRRRARHRVEKA